MKFRPRDPSSGLSLEALEQRQVLSTAFVAPSPSLVPYDLSSAMDSDGAARNAALQRWVNVSPGDGAALPTSNPPTTIVARLDAKIINDWRNGDIALYRLEADGSITSIFDRERPPDATTDRVNNTVTIPLDGALGPGRYRIALRGGADSFSRLISDGSWDYLEDQTLAEFEVVEQGVGFDSAVDAGTVGAIPRSFAGSLKSSGDMAFYKITLGVDQPLWRLGLQVDAKRVGSGLLATLTVYDAQGNRVAASEGRRGLASAPDDPYLFVGLQPGTYYVGVSAARGRQSSGDYRLGIVADPVEAPTRVIDFALDWTQGAPTGFTITFSDAISPDSLAAAGASLFAVDDRGGIHPAFLTAADGGLRRLSFVFDQPIPAGGYRLVSPSGGGLADLIGRAPVADGQPLGGLASWTVAPHRPSGGPSSPAMDPGNWLDSAHLESLIDNAVGPGGALSLRFGVGRGGGTAPPNNPDPVFGRSDPAVGSAAAELPSSFVGVLDSDLVGRPAAWSEGTLSVGPIPPQGRLLLANIAGERLAADSPAPSPADDGLPRSPNGRLETVRPEPSPVAPPEAPRLVEFPRDRRAESIDEADRADAEALERIENDRLTAAATDAIQWLFGFPDREPDDHPDPEQADARLLARIDKEESPRVEDSPEDRAEGGGVRRAGLGMPVGVVVGMAVAYRLRRRPPRWWRRRLSDKVDGAARPSSRPPQGPRHAVPPRPAFQRGGSSRKNVRQ